jgi:hypothetical protein
MWLARMDGPLGWLYNSVHSPHSVAVGTCRPLWHGLPTVTHKVTEGLLLPIGKRRPAVETVRGRETRAQQGFRFPEYT